MLCELCGGPISGKPIRAWVEGAEMTLCSRCSRYGSALKPASINTTRKPVPRKPKDLRMEAEDVVLVSNYSSIIRQAREKMGLTQADLARLLGEKESVIRRLESGRMTPSLELAKKLERLLKIKLYEEATQERELPKPPAFHLTLGDVAVIRERNKK